MWWFVDQQGVSVLCNRFKKGCFAHYTFLNLGVIQVAEWFAGCSAQRPSSCKHVMWLCPASLSSLSTEVFSGLNAISFAIACLTLAGVLGWVTWRLQMACPWTAMYPYSAQCFFAKQWGHVYSLWPCCHAFRLDQAGHGSGCFAPQCPRWAGESRLPLSSVMMWKPPSPAFATLDLSLHSLESFRGFFVARICGG